MSGSYQGGRSLVGTGNATADVTRLFAQMTLLPFSTFVYSMEVFLEAMKAMQRVADQSINATAGGAAQTPGDVTGGVGGFFNGVTTRTTGGLAGSTRQATREEERTMSDQNWSRDQDSGRRDLSYQDSGRRDQSYYQDSSRRDQDWDNRERGQRSDQRRRDRDDRWDVSDDCYESDPCDRLRLVRYKILFLKRGYEVAFPEQEELVDENISRDGFISWKIAEFVQRMERGEIPVPSKWRDEQYPPPHEPRPGETRRERVIAGNVHELPDADKKYLRVYVQVLHWYDREKRNYERDQADELREIRRVLECLCPPEKQGSKNGGKGDITET